MRKRIAAVLTALVLTLAAAVCANAVDDIQTLDITAAGEIRCRKSGIRFRGDLPEAATVRITVTGPEGVVFSTVNELDAPGSFQSEPIYLPVVNDGQTEYDAAVNVNGQESSIRIIREEDQIKNIPAHSAGHKLDSSTTVSIIDVKGDADRTFPMITGGEDAGIKGRKIGSVRVVVDNWQLRVSAKSSCGRVSDGRVFVAESRDQINDIGYAEFGGLTGGLGDTIMLDQMSPIAVYVVLTVAADLSELSQAEQIAEELDGQKALFDQMR